MPALDWDEVLKSLQEEIMTANTETVSLKIPAQKISSPPIDDDGVSAGENCGHWLGFWYGWWVCWWAGFFISSIPVSFILSFLGRKLCSLTLKGSRKLCSYPVKVTYCSSVFKYLMKQGDQDEAYSAEGLSEEISKWKKQMPGIVLGTVIGVFQIINCILRQYEVGGAIFGVIFGFVLMVLNSHVPKLMV